jgi:hypothetical protein
MVPGRRALGVEHERVVTKHLKEDDPLIATTFDLRTLLK